MFNTVWTLFLVFFVLKVTGNIDWSWLWVLSPIWIIAILIAFAFTYFLFDEHKHDGVKDVE